MKKIATISLIFISVLTLAQENQKGVKENGSVKQTEQPSNGPTTYFRTYTGTVEISKKEIMEMDTIKVHGKNEKTDLSKYIVVGYEITVGVDTKKFKSLTCKGSTVSREAKDLLKEVVSGSKVFVDNVTATDSKGKVVKAPGISFKVQ